MQVDILERVTAFTSLGIRFWDAALDRPVAERLAVTARPLDAPTARPVRAFRTLSGVEALMGLPGSARSSGAIRTRHRRRRAASSSRSPIPAAASCRSPSPSTCRCPTAGCSSARPRARRSPSRAFCSDPPRSGGGPAGSRRCAASWPRRREAPAPRRPCRGPRDRSRGAEWYGLADAAGRFAVLFPGPRPRRRSRPPAHRRRPAGGRAELGPHAAGRLRARRAGAAAGHMLPA